MKVGVIGTANKDKLVLPSGAVVKAWGGIVYNLLTLNHYLGHKGAIKPICCVGADCRETFPALLRKFTSIDQNALHHVAQRQNRVILKCHSHEDKEETADLSLPPVPFDHIAKHLDDLDFLIVNFSSGRDITQETLRKIRRAYLKPILVDVHSLTLSDPDARNQRRLRGLHDWQDWLEGIEYVQLSWNECTSLTGETSTSISGLVKAADWLLEHGTLGVIVTRGEAGALYFHNDDQGILKEEIEPFPLHTVIDSTGCGDVFSAAFVSYMLMTGKTMKALNFAVKASALKATFSGLGPWLNG
ncbi:MAG: carbohydrate kinase family protein [bacterium]|nr:carbohydrate kinase family protein [bacterium]